MVGLVSYGLLSGPIESVEVLCELPAFSEPERGWKRWLDVVSASVRVRRAVGRFSPDLVHAHFLTGPAWLGAAGGGAPLVVTAWGSDVFVDARRPLVRVLHRATLRRAALATCESRALATALVDLGMPDNRIRRVLWGVDMQRFSPGPARSELVEELGLHAGTLVLLAMRGVREIQNPSSILAALAELRARGRDATLVLLLGPGGFDALPAPLVDDLARLGLDDHVRVLGHLPHERLVDLYRLADVCLSVPSSDSTSIAVLEAMACGKPVVASDIPANREWIDDRTNGMLVPPGDASALAAAVDWIAASGRTSRLGVSARERVVGAADEKIEMDRMECFYRSLVSGDPLGD